MKNFIKEYFPYVLIVSCITLPFFLNSGYVFLVDFNFGPNVSADILNSNFLVVLIIKILSLFYFYPFGEKLFISLVLFLVLLGGKKIAEHLSQNRWIVIITSLFLLFNPFVYQRIMYGQISIVGAFGLLCLSLGYSLSYIKEGKNSNLYMWSILNALSFQFSTHFVFLSFLLNFSFLAILFFLKTDKRKLLKIILVLLFCAITLNLNWILGYIIKPSQLNFNQRFTYDDLEAFQISGQNGLEALGNVVMMSGFWAKERGIYVDLSGVGQIWGTSFLLLLPIILAGLFFGLRKKEHRPMLLGLIFIFFIAVILAVGIRLPVSREITYWLFNNVPFYKGLRESGKWVSLIVVIYGILLALGLEHLSKYKIIRENKTLSVVLICLLIVMQSPFLLFGFYGQTRPVNYPEDWKEINKYIASQQDGKYCKDLVLFLPWHLYMSFSWIDNRLIANPANSFFSCKIIQGTNMEWAGIYDNSGDKNGMIIEQWIKEKKSVDFFKNNGLNIKYIILAKEVDWQEYQWIDKIDGLKIEKETDNLKLYRVN